MTNSASNRSFNMRKLETCKRETLHKGHSLERWNQFVSDTIRYDSSLAVYARTRNLEQMMVDFRLWNECAA